MNQYNFYFKDGTVETGRGCSGLNAWHRLGHTTHAWGMLHYAKEI